MLKEGYDLTRQSSNYTDATLSSGTSSASEDSIGGSWDDDDSDTKVALLPHELRSGRPRVVLEQTKESSGTRSTDSSKLRLKFSVLILLTASFLVGMFAERVNNPILDEKPVKHVASGTNLNMIKDIGWVNLIEKLRQEISLVATEMGAHEKHIPKNERTEFIDIAPFVEKMNEVLDTIGVRGVYADLFDGLQEYVPGKKKSKCDVHGAGCKPNSFWWLCHYTGALTAEKLLKEGSLLLDGATGERIHDGAAFMKELHNLQRRPYAGKMSFHAEHAFLWHYVASTIPDLDDYPHELADSFCSEFLTNKVRNHHTKKYLGLECYHGMGHAVYYALARRQENLDPADLSASIQFRPKGGFALSEENFCHGYNDICLNAPDVVDTPVERCRGGMRHSQRLYLGYKDNDKVNYLVDRLADRCLEKLEK